MKKCKVYFLSSARQDLKKVKAYYREINPELVKRFILEMDLFVSKIEDWPQYAAVRYNNIRIANFRKFPYTIHYYYDAAVQTAYVIGVFHIASDPNKGFTRAAE